MRMVLDRSNWSKFKSSLQSPMCRHDCVLVPELSCFAAYHPIDWTHRPMRLTTPVQTIWDIYIRQYSLKRGTCEYRSVMCQCQRCLDYHRALSTGPPSGPEHLARKTSSRSAPTRAAVTHFKPWTYINVSRCYSQATRRAELGQGTPLLSEQVLCGPDQPSS